MAALKNMRIAFIGSGKVATNLAQIFHENGLTITEICSRNQFTGKALAKAIQGNYCSDASALKAELIVICTNDSSLAELFKRLPTRSWVVYTAGALPLIDFPSEKWGVFYPLQSFSEQRKLNSAEIPILLETNSQELQSILEQLCSLCAFSFQNCDSRDRINYHLAAVFINNFVNHIIFQAQEHLAKKELDWRILLPLLHETIAKLQFTSAGESQTGPARRKDEKTLELHRQLLSDSEREIYDVLSKSILKTYSNND